MAFFSRFDICDAYLAFEQEWNKGGWLHERASNRRRHESIGVQLHRMGYEMAPHFNGYDSLTENGKDIYAGLLERYGFKENR